MIKTNDWKKNIPLGIRLRVFIRNLYIKNIYNPYQVFRRKNGWANHDLFQHIKIQTNYQCTRRCSFCYYGMDIPHKNIEMDSTLYYKIIDQLKALSYQGIVSLYECNEPLTDRRLPDFLRYARKQLPNAQFFITTNGDLLKQGDVESLFSDGLNYMYLNSYDKKAYSRNINLLTNINKQLRKNIKHIDRTYQSSWTSRAGNIKQFHKQALCNPCDMVYLVFYIKPDGEAYSCINDFFNVNEMGNLNNQTLLEVWFGDTFKNLRRELNRGNRGYSSLCAQCDYVGYTNLPKVPLSKRIRRFFCH